MKLPLPKRISIRTFTTFVLVVVILTEIYLAYFFLYNKLSPQPEVTVNTSIVRINRSSLSDVTQFLDGLDVYQPQPLNLVNPNPLKYSQ